MQTFFDSKKQSNIPVSSERQSTSLETTLSNILLTFDFMKMHLRASGSPINEEQNNLILDFLRTGLIEKLFSIEDFISLSSDQIKNLCTITLINPDCITALKEKRTTILQLAELDEHALTTAIETDDYPQRGSQLN